MFDKLIWKKDRMLIDNLVFRMEHEETSDKNFDENHFIFYKIKTLVDQYDAYFKSNPLNEPIKNMVEIGMWDGGSAVFWNEILKPNKIVGIDLMDTGGGKYFNKYLDKINIGGQKKIASYWSTDQSNAPKLRQIVDENFGNEPLDLVFDDGSNMYEPTLKAFNALFPYMKTGGLYFIEDWAWNHWKGFENMYPPNTEPSRLIYELVQASGNVGLIESITVYQGFVVVKRGMETIKSNFLLHDYIYNRPKSNEYFNYLKSYSIKDKIKMALKILIS